MVDRAAPTPQPTKTPVPNTRAELSQDLQREFEAALGDVSLDEMLGAERAAPGAVPLEPDSRHMARVVQIHNDDVFVELGGRDQGVLSLAACPEPPLVGNLLEVIVSRYNPEDGLYTLALPGAAAPVEDWSQLAEGLLVEARVTGHNKGGLECEVNGIRGFIPASQVAAFRVEDLSQFVGEKFNCIVTEADQEKRNLVLSRRAVLEREMAEARDHALGQLAEGQECEGVVRSLMDFGAFVDLGGIDGLIHISQMSWHRVKHPSEVLEVGQRVKVLVRKIDAENGRIGLSLRDLVENPWQTAVHRYPVSTVVTGTITRVADFGAFVELEPGVEGLVHISELSHNRVWRVSDVVSEGDRVEAKVTSIDAEQQRIGLSMKAVMARPEPVKKDLEAEAAEQPELPPVPQVHKKLKGGTGRKSGGNQFGLKW